MLFISSFLLYLLQPLDLQFFRTLSGLHPVSLLALVNFPTSRNFRYSFLDFPYRDLHYKLFYSYPAYIHTYVSHSISLQYYYYFSIRYFRRFLPRNTLLYILYISLCRFTLAYFVSLLLFLIRAPTVSSSFLINPIQPTDADVYVSRFFAYDRLRSHFFRKFRACLPTSFRVSLSNFPHFCIFI